MHHRALLLALFVTGKVRFFLYRNLSAEGRGPQFLPPAVFLLADLNDYLLTDGCCHMPRMQVSAATRTVDNSAHARALATDCPAGLFLFSEACFMCPDGQYQPIEAFTGNQCTDCPAGTYTVHPSDGFNGQNCTSCPSGTYQVPSFALFVSIMIVLFLLAAANNCC